MSFVSSPNCWPTKPSNAYASGHYCMPCMPAVYPGYNLRDDGQLSPRYYPVQLANICYILHSPAETEPGRISNARKTRQLNSTGGPRRQLQCSYVDVVFCITTVSNGQLAIRSWPSHIRGRTDNGEASQPLARFPYHQKAGRNSPSRF